ncbi:hypothetical protein MC885_007465, partial [Smutsia gigantea]
CGGGLEGGRGRPEPKSRNRKGPPPPEAPPAPGPGVSAGGPGERKSPLRGPLPAPRAARRPRGSAKRFQARRCRSWEPPGEEEAAPARALETLSNGQGSQCPDPPRDDCCLQQGALTTHVGGMDFLNRC